MFAEPYVGVIGGGTGGYELKDSKLETSWGYYLGGRVGFTTCNVFRIEEEFCFQHSDLRSISKHGFSRHHVKGHIDIWSCLTNFIVDFDIPFLISPFFGGGVGYAQANGEGMGGYSHKVKNHCHHGGFAWQALLGVKLCSLFGFETNFEYRYFKLTEIEANHRLGISATKLF